MTTVSESIFRDIPLIVANRSGAPTPQFAPKPERLRFLALSARSAGEIPIIVLPAVSKLIVAQTGKSKSLIASRAASNSSIEYIVSSHKTSTPPSARPSACALKALDA